MVVTAAARPSSRYATRALSYWVFSASRSWRLAVVSNIANPVLYLAAMGLGLGHLVDRSGRSHAGLGGLSYVDFLAPALLATAALQSSAGEASYPVMGAIRWNRTYEAMLATPLSVLDVWRGHLLFIIGRTTVVCAAFLAVAAAFGALHSPLAVLMVPVAALLATGCAGLVAAMAATVEGDVAFAVLFRLIVVPLVLFSGTFAPLAQLPGWITPIAYATPLYHAVQLCRGASAGSLPVGASVVHLAYLVVLAAVGYRLAARAYARRLSR